MMMMIACLIRVREQFESTNEKANVCYLFCLVFIFSIFIFIFYFFFIFFFFFILTPVFWSLTCPTSGSPI